MFKCTICDVKSKQKCHHNTHLKSEKHKLKCDNLKLTLEKMNIEKIKKKYPVYNNYKQKSTLIQKIISDYSTVKEKESKTTGLSYLRLPENTNKDLIINTIQFDKETTQQIVKFVDKNHQILYDYEQIEGLDAMNDIMSLTFLKLIETKISDKIEVGKIDLTNPIYYEDQFTTDDFKLLQFDELEKQKYLRTKNQDEADKITRLGLILKSHPVTKLVFQQENFLNVEQNSTARDIIENINKFDIKYINNSADAIGEIYEHFVSKYTKTNSKLSQYFTPRKLMYLILSLDGELFKSKLEEFKTIGKTFLVYDPCMGTAGWLVIFFSFFKEYKDIIELGGNEIKANTFMYALMNLINATNKMPLYVDRGNSLTKINSKEKFDAILQNPPFNTDVKFKRIQEQYEAEENGKSEEDRNPSDEFDKIYILKDDNPPIQFLELSIYKLNNGGICSIVLPYGKLFFGDSYKKQRKYLLDTINITRIIIHPPGIFTHTPVKTCTVTFIKGSPTESIEYFKSNKECNDLVKMTDVSIADIMKEPHHSLFHTNYLHDSLIENLINVTNYKWIEFGELFTLEKGILQSSKIEEEIDGNGVCVTQSKNKDDYKKINDTKLDGENLFIGTIDSGKQFCIIKYCGKCNFTNLLYHCKTLNNINVIFYYYYFKSIRNHLTLTYLKGSTNLSLDKENFDRMKVPLPPIQIQNELVDKMNIANEEIDCLQKLRDIAQRKINIYLDFSIKVEVQKKTMKCIQFGELFTLEKGQLSSESTEDDINGDILLITKADNKIIKRYINYDIYINEGCFIADAFNGNGKCPIRYSDNKCIHSNLMLYMKPVDIYENIINIKYIYYYLNSIKEHIETFYEKGSCNLSLDKKNLNRMKVPLPPIETQNEILKGIEKIENLIKLYNENIEEIQENISTKFMEYFKDYSHLENSENISINNNSHDESSDDDSDDDSNDDSSEQKKEPSKKKPDSKELVSDEELTSQHAIADSLNDTSDDFQSKLDGLAKNKKKPYQEILDKYEIKYAKSATIEKLKDLILKNKEEKNIQI